MKYETIVKTNEFELNTIINMNINNIVFVGKKP